MSGSMTTMTCRVLRALASCAAAHTAAARRKPTSRAFRSGDIPAVSKRLILHRDDSSLWRYSAPGVQSPRRCLNLVRAAIALRQHGESAGSTTTTLMLGFLDFRYWPARSPCARPAPETKMSTFAAGTSQISGPVVALWMAAICGVDKTARDERGSVFSWPALPFSRWRPACPSRPSVSNSSRRTFKGLPSLNAHRLRHREYDAVSARCSHRASPMPVLRCGLDDHAVRLEHAPLLRVFNHRLGDPVLHAARGIVIFQLANQLRRKAVLFLVVRQFQQRRFSDQFRQSFILSVYMIIPPYILVFSYMFNMIFLYLRVFPICQ